MFTFLCSQDEKMDLQRFKFIRKFVANTVPNLHEFAPKQNYKFTTNLQPLQTSKYRDCG